MNNFFRRSLPDNTNRHALVLVHTRCLGLHSQDVLYSVNPGLWDIQLSSRDFCEIIAKVFRSPRSSDQRRFRQASGHHPRTRDQATGYLCDQHRTCVRCTLYRWQAITDTTDRQRFSLSLGCFPPKETRLDTTHTQRDSCVVERHFDFQGYDFWTVQPFQRFTLFSEAYLACLIKASCFPTVSQTSGVSWVMNFLPNYTALSCFHVSCRQANQVPLSLSRPS